MELLPGEKHQSFSASLLKISSASTPNASDESKRDRYEKEQEEIKSEAQQKEAAAKSNFHKHEIFAGGVTMFQIAIAIAAISALTKKRQFWTRKPAFRRRWLRVSRLCRDCEVAGDLIIPNQSLTRSRGSRKNLVDFVIRRFTLSSHA